MSTLRVIAAAAGVHVATASAILNSTTGNTRVSEETRQRVLKAAQKHSYVPNELARRLRTGRSNLIGFLGGDLRNPFFAELTAALESELAQHDLQIMVTHVTQAETLTIEKTIESLRQQSVKSIICWEESAHLPFRRKKSKTSLVSVGFTDQERPGVWLDLEYAIEMAVEAMTERGLKKIGFFFPQGQKESPSVVARSHLFTEVCRKRALPTPVLASYAGESWELVASIQGAAEVLKKYPRIEAWIGFNDIAGLGLLRHLPQKWSSRVLCFDGTLLSRSWPGHPLFLDLKISEFARAITSVVSGQKEAVLLGERSQWLRPELRQS